MREIRYSICTMTDFRDPGVFWDDAAHHWVMAVSLPKEHKVRFYSSPNLKDWTQLSEFGPAGDVAGDLGVSRISFVVPSENGKESLWVLKVGLNPGAPQGGSGEQYFFGSFDGKNFIASNEAGAHGWTNYGKDDYCAISLQRIAPRRKASSDRMDEQLAVRREIAHCALARADELASTTLVCER